jgi:hypothetical protein
MIKLGSNILTHMMVKDITHAAYILLESGSMVHRRPNKNERY